MIFLFFSFLKKGEGGSGEEPGEGNLYLKDTVKRFLHLIHKESRLFLNFSSTATTKELGLIFLLMTSFA